MLTNPYKNFDQDHLKRVSGHIPPEVKAQISAICPDRGIHQIMVAHFYKAIAEELQERNILHYTENNEQILHEIIQRRTDKFSIGETTPRDDGRRKRTVRKRAKQTKTKSASVETEV